MHGTMWTFRDTFTRRPQQVHLNVHFPVPFGPMHEHDVHGHGQVQGKVQVEVKVKV